MNWLGAAALLLISLGCSSNEPPARPDSTGLSGARGFDLTPRALGIVSHFGDGPDIQVPSGARVGEPMAMSVTTYGGGCVSEDTTIIAVDSLTADIRPYQRIPNYARACTMELLVNRRALLVTFGVRGRATIKIHGRAVPGDSTLSIVRTVLVQ